MKKLYVKLILLFFWAAFWGCKAPSASHTSTGKLKIAVSIAPQGDLLRMLADTLAGVHVIVPEGKNPEVYDPQPQEMQEIADCDAYFYIGDLGFEKAWAKRIGQMNSHLQVFRLMPEHHHHHDEEVCTGGHDPHVWTSPQGIMMLAERMQSALDSLAPEHQADFRHGMEQLRQDIAVLRDSVTQILTSAPSRCFVIYHPSLTGFAEEFGFHQLVIEQDGKEPTPNRLEELIRQAKAEKASVVFIQQEFNGEMARSVAEELGVRISIIRPLAADWSEQILFIANELAQPK